MTDPKDLRRLAGLKSATDVYRTLDKMALRREYHEALAKNGVDFDFLIGGVKDLCVNAGKEQVRLKGYELFLRSLGLDRNDKMEDQSNSWEETIIKITEKEKEQLAPGDQPIAPVSDDDEYVVNVPQIPEEEAKKRQEHQEFSDDFYG